MKLLDMQHYSYLYHIYVLPEVSFICVLHKHFLSTSLGTLAEHM
jgi:hypothetical protein